MTTELVTGFGPMGEEQLRPVVGLIFRERMSASGKVDRVRLIDSGFAEMCTPRQAQFDEPSAAR